MPKNSPANGVEQAVTAVVAVSHGEVAPTEEKPTSWWKQAEFLRALSAAAALLALIVVVIVVATLLNGSQESPSSEGTTSAFRPSLEPSSTPPPPPSPSPSSMDDIPSQEEVIETASELSATPSISISPSSSPSTFPTVSPTVQPPPFAFYVMGDVPYTDAEAIILADQFTNMTKTLHPGAHFVVHVGDFQRWQITACLEFAYTDFRDTVLTSPLPVLVLAGDNDYIDCPNINQSRTYLLESFSTIEKSWSNRLPPGVNELEVNRWLAKRPEMFSFVNDGILFLSVNLMNAQDEQVNSAEWRSLIDDSATWAQNETEAAFSQHVIRGVVMFCHAMPSPQVRGHFETLMEQVFQERLDLPVLNIHGDGHVFGIDQPYPNSWESFTHIQVDQGGKADPLLVEVAPLVNGVMEPLTADDSGLQHVFGEGLFRIDRQNGVYPDSG